MRLRNCQTRPIVETMPNTLAYIVLFGWPIVVLVLFRLLPAAQAFGWSVLAGYLLLPTQAGLDLPGVPSLDKDGVPVLSAGLMLLLGVGAARTGKRARDTADPAPRRHWLASALLVLLLVSPLLTVLTNADPVIVGPFLIPGLRLYDAASIIGALAISVLPFLLAQRLFASPESHVALLKMLVLGLLCYSLPILFEVRMSPQLNTMLYGFFPHDFLQHIRADGFRPVVFLHHGLWLAILVAMSVLAALALWRQRLAEGARAGQWLFAAIYLLVILLLCKSLGASLILLVFLPAALLMGVRGQLILAALVAGVVLLYPMLRAAQVVPVERVIALAQSISADRAASFEFRLTNEEALMERAALRPLAGWGTWGRPLIHNSESGQSTSVTDGAWIISIGSFGWLGYIASFGLLTLPILLLARNGRKLGLSPATAGLALVMAANLLDLLSNATLTPITWLIGGALLGRHAHVTRAGEDAARFAPPPRRSWGLVTDLAATRSSPESGGGAGRRAHNL